MYSGTGRGDRAPAAAPERLQDDRPLCHSRLTCDACRRSRARHQGCALRLCRNTCRPARTHRLRRAPPGRDAQRASDRCRASVEHVQYGAPYAQARHLWRDGRGWRGGFGRCGGFVRGDRVGRQCRHRQRRRGGYVHMCPPWSPPTGLAVGLTRRPRTMACAGEGVTAASAADSPHPDRPLTIRQWVPRSPPTTEATRLSQAGHDRAATTGFSVRLITQAAVQGHQRSKTRVFYVLAAAMLGPWRDFSTRVFDGRPSNSDNHP
jgi:hypothetical protein